MAQSVAEETQPSREKKKGRIRVEDPSLELLLLDVPGTASLLCV